MLYTYAVCIGQGYGQQEWHAVTPVVGAMLQSVDVGAGFKLYVITD